MSVSGATQPPPSVHDQVNPEPRPNGAGDRLPGVRAIRGTTGGKVPVWIQTFCLALQQAFRFSVEEYENQRRSMQAVAVKVSRNPRRAALLKEFVQLAIEVTKNPATRSPVKVWQAQVTKILAQEREAKHGQEAEKQRREEARHQN